MLSQDKRKHRQLRKENFQRSLDLARRQETLSRELRDCHEPRPLRADSGPPIGKRTISWPRSTAASLKGSGPLIYREPNGPGRVGRGARCELMF